MKTFYVYIMTNRSGTLYTGFTSNLTHRVGQQRTGEPAGFASRYRIDRLVYFESTADVRVALDREKKIKSWSRSKRIALINSVNPKWLDLLPPEPVESLVRRADPHLSFRAKRGISPTSTDSQSPERKLSS